MRRMLNVLYLKTPLQEREVRRLRAGDLVYLTGKKVYVISTSAAQYFFDSLEKGEPFFDLKGSVIYHSSLALSESKKVRWVGATTSIMCEIETPRLIDLGSRAIMGKGGLGKSSQEAMSRRGAVYLATVGGASSVYARCVTGVIRLIDTPQRMAELEVENFGPLIVGMDAHGRNLFSEHWRSAREKATELSGARVESLLYGRLY